MKPVEKTQGYEKSRRLDRDKRYCRCFNDGSCWEIIIIKQIHTFTSSMFFGKKHTAGERVDLLDDTAGALQTFSGKRKLAKTLLRIIRLTKN